jgi:hypothetical protein
MRIELPLRRTYGTVTFPDDPLVSGCRNVLFELARAVSHARPPARGASRRSVDDRGQAHAYSPSWK